jgi:replicative DNA helicase
VDDIGFLPPQNIEAEMDVIGSILYDGECMKRVMPILQPIDFYKESHRVIYTALLKLYEDREPIDTQAVVTRLRAHDHLEAVGGFGYLIGLANGIVTTVNVANHAKMIKEQSQKRSLIVICRRVIDSVKENEVAEIVTSLRLEIGNLLTGYGCEIVTMLEVTKETFGAIERRCERGNLSGITSGIEAVDKVTDGWQKGDFIVLAARPGMGKSAMAMQWAQDSGVSCGFVSLEMGKLQLGIRALAHLSGVELWKLRKGVLGRDEWKYLTPAAGKMAELPISFTFKAQKISEIERTVIEMIEKHKVQLIFVDYLQRASSNEPKKREQEVAEISRYLKGVALRNEIPVISLAQLNRKVEDRMDKKPTLADLRESGQIEQDADIVMFLSGEYKQGNGPATLTFAKGRNIGAGEVKLYFNGDLQKFTETEENI